LLELTRRKGQSVIINNELLLRVKTLSNGYVRLEVDDDYALDPLPTVKIQVGEYLKVDEMYVHVLNISKSSVRLGFAGDYTVLRQELLDE